MWHSLQMKLADAVRVTPRTRSGGSDASRVLRKKTSMGSRGSADSDPGRGPAASSSKESLDSSSAALEGAEAARASRREGSKWDSGNSEGAGTGSVKGKAQSGRGPLGLETR